MEGDNQQSINLSFTWLVLDTIKRMRDAKAGGEKEKYSDYCEFGLQLVQDHLEFSLRERIAKDHKALKTEIAKLKQEEKNELSRKTKIENLREEFADSHRGYILSSLSKIGIVLVRDEGVIDFAKLDIDKMANIVRMSGAGLPTAIEKKVEPNGVGR